MFILLNSSFSYLWFWNFLSPEIWRRVLWYRGITNRKTGCFYEGFSQSIQPYWISREPVAWPWRNLSASQWRPYCATVNSHSPVVLFSRQWDAVDWVSVLSHSQWPGEQISFITTMRVPILQLSCRPFWQSITSPRSVSSPRTLQHRFGSPRLLAFPQS